jgi:hypothetical protein
MLPGYNVDWTLWDYRLHFYQASLNSQHQYNEDKIDGIRGLHMLSGFWYWYKIIFTFKS